MSKTKKKLPPGRHKMVPRHIKRWREIEKQLWPVIQGLLPQEGLEIEDLYLAVRLEIQKECGKLPGWVRFNDIANVAKMNGCEIVGMNKDYAHWIPCGHEVIKPCTKKTTTVA